VRHPGLPGLTLAAALAAAAVAAPPGPSVAVTVSKRGFEPSAITVRRGEMTRFFLTSADVEHCFAIDALRVEKRVVPGRPTQMDLTPERAGVFPFYCCLESGKTSEVERGQLTVSE
jgi:heme/copper-type cytochrome/quinol oxidase subunit 2